MAHLSGLNDDLVARVRRISGQMKALEKGLETGLECDKLLHLAAATRGAMNGLMDEIIRQHAMEHVAAPGLTDAERKAGAEDLIEAIRRYAK